MVGSGTLALGAVSSASLPCSVGLAVWGLDRAAREARGEEDSSCALPWEGACHSWTAGYTRNKRS